MGYDAKFRIWRGDASGGGLQDYAVEVNEGEVVPTSSTGSSDAGRGSGGAVELQGGQVRIVFRGDQRPARLMCMTRMSTFAEDEVVTVTPMRTFPVIRDLVTDVSFNYTKAREIPSFTPPPGLAPGDYG